MTESTVDQDGNTLFHAAAVSNVDGISGPEAISERGIDINQVNNVGHTPLHVFCSVDRYEDLSWSPDQRKNLGYILQQCKDVDALDPDGVTPLHLASTFSEFLVRDLLVFGADASIATSEGLTALHLAARARQSNIVGMLIMSLSQKHGEEGLATHCNAKDQLGRTPLYYACRSGRPESVELLFAAGADPNVQNGEGMTLLDACVEFEEEQALWADYRRPTLEEVKRLCFHDQLMHYDPIAGIKIEDKLRPFIAQGRAMYDGPHYMRRLSIQSEQDTTRLEEILEMLLKAFRECGRNTEWISSALGKATQSWELKGYAYGIRVLKHLERLTVENDIATHIDEQDLQALFHDPVSLTMGTFERLLCDRQYSAIEGLFQRDDIDPVETDELLRLLAKHGFAYLLSRIPIHAGARSDPKLGSELMSVACQRTLPNMSVIRVLVEKFAIDDDTTSQALQQLARGSHWWQPEEGIPYLLSVGAKPALCIGIAFRSSNIFAKEAVLALLNGGTDIHSESNEDNGCSTLEMAASSAHADLEIVQRILSTGVPITATALFAAIKTRAVAVLDLLLRSGADPNQRLDGVSNAGIVESRVNDNCTSNSSDPCFYMRQGRREWYALHRAAAPYFIASEEERIQSYNMISALMRSGADMYAIYRQPLRCPRKESDIFPGCATNMEKIENDFDDDEVSDFDDDEEKDFDDEENDFDEWNTFDTEDTKSQRTKEYGLQSILHGLLENGFLVEAILSQPSGKRIDIEHRNPQGRTPLLSACRSALGADASIDAFVGDLVAKVHKGGDQRDPSTSQKPTILGSLLSLGADPLATDIYGKNALHHLLEAHGYRGSPAPAIHDSLQRLTTEYPQLVNQPDSRGTYPLHSALQRLRLYRLLKYFQHCYTLDAITLLLDAGADPTVRDARGNTALHYLADGLAEVIFGDEQRQVFKVFLDRGLDVNASNDAGQTPLVILLQDDGARSKQRSSFYPSGVPPEPTRSEQEVDAEVFEMFERAGAKWDARGSEGQTLLNLLAQYNIKRTAWRWKFMVGRGLDPLARDDSGRTALETAEASGLLSKLGIVS